MGVVSCHLVSSRQGGAAPQSLDLLPLLLTSFGSGGGQGRHPATVPASPPPGLLCFWSSTYTAWLGWWREGGRTSLAALSFAPRYLASDFAA